jgi:hypothetical protein
MDVTSMKDLETRGFVLVPGFLSPEDLRFLQDDAAHAPSDGNRNYHLMTASPEATALVERRVDDLLERINSETALQVHAPAGANYFATGVETGIDFPWHQDHESYFLFQNHYDYLNFYMPIVKPDVAKSNVSLLPFDVLEREAPGVHRMALRSGARHFHQVGRRWISISDETGAMRLMPKHLPDLACTPHLAAGDLLLFRGDMLHRTQDTDTVRVAMSIRRVSRTTPISRKRMVDGGLRKALMMSNFPLPYQYLLDAFDAAGQEVMTYDELHELAVTLPPPAALGRKAFLQRLLVEKRRAHTLTSLVVDAPRAVGLRLFIAAQMQVRRLRARSAST